MHARHPSYVHNSRDPVSWRTSSDQLSEQRASRSPAQHLDLLPPQAQQVSPASGRQPWNSDTCCTEHAIPSLMLQHSRHSRSPFQAVWREDDCGTGSLVMAHVDTTEHSLDSRSHCIVLTNWSEVYWLTKLHHRTFPSLATSPLSRCATVVHQSEPGNTICCMSRIPRCQRICFADPITESLLHLTSQDSCVCSDFYAHWLLRGNPLHDRFLETSQAPTQRQASCLRHVQSSLIVIVQCRTSTRSSWTSILRWMQSGSSLHSLTCFSWQQLSLPSIRLGCFATWHTRSTTRLFCYNQRIHFWATLLSLGKRERALDATDAEQKRHQLLYTACQVNSCSAICLAPGSGRIFSQGIIRVLLVLLLGVLHVLNLDPVDALNSLVSRVRNPAGSSPRTETKASHQSRFFAASRMSQREGGEKTKKRGKKEKNIRWKKEKTFENFRSTKLTHPRIKAQNSASPLDNATHICKHDMCLSKRVPRLTIAPVVPFLPSKSSAIRLSWTRTATHVSCSSSNIDPTFWVLTCVHFVALSCVSWYTSLLQRCQPFLSDMRQLNHQAAVRGRLCWRDFLWVFDLCCSIAFPLTRGESTPFAPTSFIVSKVWSAWDRPSSQTPRRSCGSALDPRFRIGNSSARKVQTGTRCRSDRAGTARMADETWEGRGRDGEIWHAHCKHLEPCVFVSVRHARKKCKENVRATQSVCTPSSHTQ